MQKLKSKYFYWIGSLGLRGVSALVEVVVAVPVKVLGVGSGPAATDIRLVFSVLAILEL